MAQRNPWSSSDESVSSSEDSNQGGEGGHREEVRVRLLNQVGTLL